MRLSTNSIDKLGERMRREAMESSDLEMFDVFQAAYDPLLLDVAHSLDALLAAKPLKFMLAGRLKRIKSTVRKLKRDENKNMALSQMGDIIGIRIIVDSVADQNQILESIKRRFRVHDVKDYRDSNKIYRSLHVVIKEERLVEIQVRTIPQHVWAVESERFGERVKEGTLVGEEKLYLNALAIALRRLECGEGVSEGDYSETPLMMNRLPISGLLNDLVKRFEVNNWEKGNSGRSFVLVYDNLTSQLLHGERPFGREERGRAVQLFQENTRRLSHSQHESLILNAPSSAVLRVTHPRFFL